MVKNHVIGHANSKKYCFILLAVFLLLAFIPVFVNWEMSLASSDNGVRTLNTVEASGINQSFVDPNYGTEEYWNEHYSGEKQYLSSIEPGSTISTGDYFINENIEVRAQDGQPGIIINGKVNLYFEVPDNNAAIPNLTIYGGNGGDTVNNAPAILLEQGNSLYVQGKGNIFAQSGDRVYTNINDLLGKNGTQPKVDWYNQEKEIVRWMLFGEGGDGGNGRNGNAAAIGTFGGNAGNGGVAHRFTDADRLYPFPTKDGNPWYWEKPDDLEVRSGKDGGAGGDSSPSKAAGDFKASGVMNITARTGSVTYPNEIPLPRTAPGGLTMYGHDAYGEGSAVFPFYYVTSFSASLSSGSGGGNGGFGFYGASIGSGGSGGTGGGAGGSGGSDTSFFWTPLAEDTPYKWKVQAGGGGAGAGATIVYGGGRDSDKGDYDDGAEQGKDWNPETATTNYAKGGIGVREHNFPTDVAAGGDGGDGGKVANAGSGGRIVSANSFNLFNHQESNNISSFEGQNADLCVAYPKEEIKIICKNSVSDENNVFDFTGQEIKPEFYIVHYPTGKILNDELQNVYRVEYLDNVAPGEATIKLTFGRAPSTSGSTVVENYITEFPAVISVNFTILEESTNFQFTGISKTDSKVYDGNELVPYIKSQLKVLNNGTDITSQLPEGSITSTFYKKNQSDLEKLDSAPKDAGEYQVNIELYVHGYTETGDLHYWHYSDTFDRTITKKTVQASLVGGSVGSVYGDEKADIKFNFTGLCKTDELIEDVDYIVHCDAKNSDVIDAGEYPITIELTQARDIIKNYDLQLSTDWNYVISKRSATISLGGELTKVYGEKDPSFYSNLEFSNFLEEEIPNRGDVNVTRKDGEDVDSDGYKVTISLNSSAQTRYSKNYEITFPTVYFFITKRTAEIKFSAVPQRMKYSGVVDFNSYLEFSGFVNGEETRLVENDDYMFYYYKHVGSEVILVDQVKDVGIYELGVAGKSNGQISKNYEIGLSYGGVTDIFPSELTFHCRDLGKQYGDVDPVLSVSYVDGMVKGEELTAIVDYTITRRTGEDVGNYVMYVELLPTEITKNYELDSEAVDGYFVISKRALNVIANKILYRQVNTPKLDLTSPQVIYETFILENLLPGETIYNVFSTYPTLTWIEGEEPADPMQKGSYGIQIDFSNAQIKDNYKITNADVPYKAKLDVFEGNLADVQLSLPIASKAYDGNTVVDFSQETVTFVNPQTGVPLVPGQDYDPVLVEISHWRVDTEAFIKLDEPPTDVGTYVFEVWLHADSQRTDSWCTYKYFGYKINKKDVDLIVDDKTAVYGNDAPQFTLTQNGFVSEDDKLDVANDCTFTLEDENNDIKHVGEYLITMELTDSGKAKETNYKFNIVSGVFSVTKKTVKAKPEASTSVYGDNIVKPDITWDGLIDGDNPAEDTDYKYNKDEGTNVGTYNTWIEVVPGGMLDKDYNVQVDISKYTITKRPATITPVDKTFTYGDEVTFDCTIDDDKARSELSLGTDFYLKVNNSNYPNVGDYLVDITYEPTSIQKLNNYTLAFTPGNFCHITKKDASFTIDNIQATYGDDEKSIVPIFTGLLDKDQPVKGVDYNVSRDDGTDAAIYNIHLSLVDGKFLKTNYNLTGDFEEKTYTISPLAITVSPTDGEKVYGNPDFGHLSILIDKTLPYEEQFVQGTDYKINGLPSYDDEYVNTFTTSIEMLGNHPNYSITCADGAYVVNKANLNVEVDKNSKIYGEQDDPGKIVVNFDGLVHDNELTYGVDYSIHRDPGETVGTYATYFDSLSTSKINNYFINNIKAEKFTISPCPVYITCDDKEKEYYEENPIFTAEAYATTEETFVLGTDYIVEVEGDGSAGEHRIFATLLDNVKTSNYVSTSIDGTLTVHEFTDFEGSTITQIEDQAYTGGEIRPKVTMYYQYEKPSLKNANNATNELVTKVFEEGVDFEVTYLNNINPGIATVNVDGIGSCEGHKSINFTILPVAGPTYIDTTNLVDNISKLGVMGGQANTIDVAAQQQDDDNSSFPIEIAVGVIVVVSALAIFIIIRRRTKKLS